MKVVFIGAGNLAVQLSQGIRRAGMTVVQVYSRTAARAGRLARLLDCGWTDRLSDVRSDAGLYVFAVGDTALPDVIAALPANDGLWVHTAGSVPMDVFAGHARRYGVLYPLQTFTAARDVRLDEVPLFIEACCEGEADGLFRIASGLSSRVMFLPSGKRRYLHLAAVFACNFTNHLYALAGDMLEREGIPADVLLPLIGETAAKVQRMPPAEAQTGPAVRNDRTVMDAHLALLHDPGLKALYEQLSNSIHKRSGHE